MFRPWCWCGRLVLPLAAWAAAAGGGRAWADAERDAWQTVQARTLLESDPELAVHNIGVRVRDRVARLWGPIPSAELGFKAELALRRMVELSEVRNELEVTDEIIAAPVPQPLPSRPQYLPDHIPPALPPHPMPDRTRVDARRAPMEPVPPARPVVSHAPAATLELPAIALPARLPDAR